MKKKNKRVMKRIEPYLWLLPSMLIFAVFTFYPFLETIIKSFFTLDSSGSIVRFVGLENYSIIFKDKKFLKSVVNTLLFVLMTVPISKIIGFVLALLANKRRKFSAFYETVFSLPMAVASSVIAMIFQLLFVPTLGFINTTFKLNIRWLTDPKWALPSVAIVQIWLSIGYAFLFLLSAVRSISDEIIESAELDGASPLRKVFTIYLPLTTPTMFYLVCSDITFMMMSMSLVNVLTKGGPNGASSTIIYYMYEQFSGSGNYTMANPVAVIAFIMTMIVTAITFIWEKKGVHY